MIYIYKIFLYISNIKIIRIVILNLIFISVFLFCSTIIFIYNNFDIVECLICARMASFLASTFNEQIYPVKADGFTACCLFDSETLAR